MARQRARLVLVQRHDPRDLRQLTPLIQPIGDRGLLVKFGDTLTDEANLAAIRFARQVERGGLAGVEEIVPNLISVLLRYEPSAIRFDRLAGEVRLLVSQPYEAAEASSEHVIEVVFDGEDLGEVAATTGLTAEQFVEAHNALLLRVLATGFAPGFVYCGMHPATLMVPRRQTVRRQIPAGTVLFAAGQTAITSTPIPTGWHVIGRTAFRNFDPAADPPVELRAGDLIRFMVT